MDRTERLVNISLTILGATCLQYLLPPKKHNWIRSLLVAHALNFFLNGHPWAFAIHQIHPDLTSSADADFDNWFDRLETLGTSSNSIAAVAVYGSHARTELGPSSDLDVRVVSYPRRRDRVMSSLLISRERAVAALTRFPIDVYVYDGPDSLGQLRDDEEPDILVDKEDWL